MGIALAGLSACDSGTVTPYCPNLPIAEGVIGQVAFDSGGANAGGVDAASLSGPVGSIASDGELTYLTDTGNNRILGYFSPPGGMGAPADFELGHGDSTGTDFSDRAAGVGPTSFSSPAKVTVSSDGRLVLADTANNRVLIWNVLPTANTPPDLVVGQPDFNSFRANQQMSAPAAHTLNGPTAALIANGQLIVADRGNNRVLIWHAVPTAPDTPADVELGQAAVRTLEDGSVQHCGSGDEDFCFRSARAGGDRVDENQADPPADDEEATDDADTEGDASADDPADETADEPLDPPQLGLSAPSDLWSDGYRLLVSDSGNNRVLYWDQIPFINNEIYTHVIGQPGPGQRDPATGPRGLDTPWGVTSDGATIFISDLGNHRVLLYGGFPLQDAPPALALFGQSDFERSAPNDADQNDESGTQIDGASDLLPRANTLHFPAGLAVSAAGKLYVADQSNNRVIIFDRADAVSGAVPSRCDGVNMRVN